MEPWNVARNDLNLKPSSSDQALSKPRRPTPRQFRKSVVESSIQTVEGETTDSRFGHTVAGAGDVNGDGFADVLAGAFGAGGTNSGEVFLYYGSRHGITKAHSWRFICPVSEAEFGHQVEGVGDVNGDGFADVVISALNGHQNTIEEGVAFVFHGSRTGLSKLPGWTFNGGQARGGYGSTVRCAGDVDGDGYDDLAVGTATRSRLEGVPAEMPALPGARTSIAIRPVFPSTTTP